MSSFLMTLMIAFVVVIIALALLGLNWFITGKCKIRSGTCGRDPTKKRDEDEECGTEVSCSLCKKSDKSKK